MADQNATKFDNFDKLNALLGFDAAKHTPLGSVLQDALTEVNKERADQAKAQAKEIVLEAIGIAEDAKKAEQNFHSARRKFNKTLGKLLGRLQGKPQQQQDENEDDENEGTES